MHIAWIGTGVMGREMALHLQASGHVVKAYNRSVEKARSLEDKGIVIANSIAACVQDVDLVISMVGFPKDVEAIYLGEAGIFANVKAGCICVDMTTSSPSLAKTLYEVGKQAGIQVMDAPVSGGDSGAKQASLSIMCGGDQATFEIIKVIFACMGTSIHYMGCAGMGQHTKACNQICVAGAVAAMSEAIHYARANQLDEQAMIAAIRGGAAGSWQLDNTASRVIKEDFAPGFYIKHFLKDMGIIQAVMLEKEEHLEMLDAVYKLYASLAKQGLENAGTQALIQYYEKDRK